MRIARPFSGSGKKIFVTLALFAPGLEKHLGAGGGEQLRFPIPIVNLETLVYQPINRPPNLSAPIMLTWIHRVIPADRGKNPFAGELMRIVEDFPEILGAFGCCHF